MATISVFTDQVNPGTQGAVPKNPTKTFGKIPYKKTPIARSRFDSTRSALGDLSNSCSRSVISGNGRDSVKSKKNSAPTVKEPVNGESPIPRRRILSSNIGSDIQKQPDKMADEIETMPHNDDDYPGTFDVVWPIEDMPTRDELKWLKRFNFGVGHSDGPDDRHIPSEDDVLLPSDFYNLSPDEPDCENSAYLVPHDFYEQEVADEPQIEENFIYSGFLLN